MKVFIHPFTNVLYSSFYIYGLEKLLGKDNVVFSKHPFGDIDSEIVSKNLPMVVKDGSKVTRCFVDLDDSYQIYDDAYSWCDVYAHVNANFEKVNVSYHDKLVPLCPSFGIRCWSKVDCSLKAIMNLFKCHPKNARKFLGKYKRMGQRLPLCDYYSSENVKQGYIFFCSTLWYNDEWNKNDEKVNAARANFIRACKSIPMLEFEGGLVSQGVGRSSDDIFKDCLTKGVCMTEWMHKTKMSEVVFNTPAFWECHGWKLGEYLALGKAIISTPISNDLPYPLEHGKNIHFVENTMDAIKEGVEWILNHPEYRIQLEKGARDYWLQYGSPLAALHLIGIN